MRAPKPGKKQTSFFGFASILNASREEEGVRSEEQRAGAPLKFLLRPWKCQARICPGVASIFSTREIQLHTVVLSACEGVCGSIKLDDF